MGLLKSFKKVLKSPLGKAALMMGLGHFGPQLFRCRFIWFRSMEKCFYLNGKIFHAWKAGL